MFREFMLFAVLLLVHELGHFVTGYLCGWKIDKIYFYPYGGCSKFHTKVNVPLWQEFLVFLMGPLMQILCYVVLCQVLMRPQDLLLLKSYHYGILLFNLLPIYPLDGGKLLSILLAKWQPFQKSFELTIGFSFVFLFCFFCFSFFQSSFFNLFFMGILILSKLLEEYRKRSLYYQKFLLERYLEPVSFPKRKIVFREEDMYRDRKHLFFYQHRYYTEQEFLKKHFKNK